MKKAEEQELRFVQSASQKTGQAVIGILLVLTGMLCFVPFWYIVCQSFSSNEAISAGKVGLLPVEFQLDSYLYVLKRASGMDHGSSRGGGSAAWHVSDGHGGLSVV